MSVQPEPACAIEGGRPWSVDRFRSEDAPGVVRLFESVYGPGYPVRTYMEPDLLTRENEALRTISSVARTDNGDIVGHNALFRSAPHPGTYESGAGLVHSAYRGGKGIFTQMAAHGLEMAKALPAVNLVFGEPVCNHPFSQKLMETLAFSCHALEVDLMPAAAYTKEASATGRVAAFLCFKTFRPRPHRVYLPGAYADELRYLYEGQDDARDFEAAHGLPPESEISDIHPQIFDFAAVARVAVHGVGGDFARRLDGLEAMLADKHVMVTQIWLNLAQPWVGAAVDILRGRGYFLGGPLPRWFDSDGLLMQKIAKQPDWEGICTINERLARTVEMVRADWQRTQKEKSNGN